MCNLMDATRIYRLGVIGAGARGETFARQLYKGTSRATLAGVCDIDAQRLAQFCDYCQIKDAPQFTDVARFMAQPDMDGVVITVPEFAHRQVAQAAFKAGKHVYLEKPIAQSLQDAYAIVDAHRASGKVCFIGFNLRASPYYQKMREIVASGVLGTLVHVSGLEQITAAHGASFMRRFHRKTANAGGMLNTKCCHDIDIILWTVGHDRHRVRRITSFGANRIFTPDKQPATHCSKCPPEIADQCPYIDRAGMVFPVGNQVPFHHPDTKTYGGDMCVYNSDKDIVDNQTALFEFDSGLTGDMSLRMFQNRARRRSVIWGERGVVEYDSFPSASLRLTTTEGETSIYTFPPRQGGHGGTDPLMIARFVEAMEAGHARDSSVEQGLAATMVAIKSDQARLSGQVVTIDPSEYR